MSPFRFYTVCLGDWDYVSTEESDQENSVRAGELKHTQNVWKQSKGRQPELPCCFLECCRAAEGAQESHPQALCLYQSTARPALLGCSRDSSCAPDLLWYKADSTRIKESLRLEKTSKIIQFKSVQELSSGSLNLQSRV